MEIRQLRTFINIVKLGNFSSAAQFLGYTQSTVTTHIQLMEKELRTHLFERFGQQITLTEDGQRLYDYAEKIVKLEDDARNALNKAHIPRGPLIIGLPESLGVYRMPALLKEFSSLYPDVELHLKFSPSSGDFRTLLRKNVMDIAFFLDTAITDSDMTCTFLWPEPVVMVASPANSLSQLPGIEPENLKNQVLVLVESSSSYRMQFLQILEKAHVQFKTTLEVGQMQAIKQLVRENLGITILPLVSVQKEIDAGELVFLPWKGPEIVINAFLVHHKDKWVNYPMRAFIKLVKERLCAPAPEPKK